MRIVARTDKGFVRDNNQDSYTACELSGGAVLAVVCDGMGGAAEGALASSEGIKAVREYVCERYLEDMSDLSIRTMLVSAVENANKHIYNLSKTNDSYEGMGTTVVAVLIAKSFLYIAHAGDSRAYKLSGGELVQLTRDHSVVQNMLEKGEITAEEAVDHPSKHIITRALGVDDFIKVDFGQEPFDEDEILLLCSDGLTNYSTPEDILRLTSDGSYYKYADRLVNLANQNGGGDNITVVFVAY
ncbi:MAG: Stp1/IreP family PP2C-type Ser/Thr phosphatase [Clostridia bacterium]|nr:Stp1/IreP family PP2C-type Ser/Thr phosphatase [Clostridia bacterium]